MGSFNAKRSLPRLRTAFAGTARFFKRHACVFVLLLIIGVSVSAGYRVFDELKKELRIVDGDSETLVKTMGNDIETAFDQLGILVETHDYISVPLSTRLSSDIMQEILIKRAVPVTITVDGKTTEVMTHYDTVGETIENNGIVLGPLDRLEGLGLADQYSWDGHQDCQGTRRGADRNRINSICNRRNTKPDNEQRRKEGSPGRG